MFGSLPTFTTSVALGVPRGPTPSGVINAVQGNELLSFSLSGNQACSTQPVFSGSLSEITVATVAQVPDPDSIWLLLTGLVAIAGAKATAERRTRRACAAHALL